MDTNKTGPKRPKKPRLTALNRLGIEACLNIGVETDPTPHGVV